MRSAREVWVFGAILVLALAFRLPGHLDSGLWFDELWLLVETIRRPFVEFYTTFDSDNNHPFYSLLAWLSVHGLGESAWTLRLPALVFGVASIGMLWIIALRVTTRRQAAVVTALMTISYHHVWFSQNARGYTMLLFWTLAATHFLLKIYDGEGQRSWILYAVCLALATYTHASALAVALAHGLLSIAVMSNPKSRTRLAGFWHPVLGLVLAGALSLCSFMRASSRIWSGSLILLWRQARRASKPVHQNGIQYGGRSGRRPIVSASGSCRGSRRL